MDTEVHNGVTMTEHDWFCRCVDCLEVKLKQANEEIVMLSKVCDSKKQRWVDLNEDEVLRLWAICKIPVHLEKPDDIGHRFARALSFGLREANYYAFCIDAREEQNT